MIALRSHFRAVVPEPFRLVLVIVYQLGMVGTALTLSWPSWGQCSAVFNCLVWWAADVFRAIMWPLYWIVQALK